MKQSWNFRLILTLAGLVTVVGVTHPGSAFGSRPVTGGPAQVELPAVPAPAQLDATAVSEADAARRLGEVAKLAYRLRTADANKAPRETLLSLADELGRAVVALGPVEHLLGASGAARREEIERLPRELRARHGDSEREIAARMTAFRARANVLHLARVGNRPEHMLEAARLLAESIREQEFNGRFIPLDPEKLRRSKDDKIEQGPAMTRNALEARIGYGPQAAIGSQPVMADAVTAAAADGATITAADPAEITPRIQVLADELGRNSIRIYRWVHDNIRFTPTYGVLRGADQTLVARQGNAYDTNLLLAALLNASGYQTRYVYGTVEVPIAEMQNWLGGVHTGEDALELMLMGGIPAQFLTSGGRISAIRFEHLWIEAYVDFIPSRGVIERTPDTWAPLDASYKQHTYDDAIDILSAAGPGLRHTLQHTIDSIEQDRDGALIGIDLNGFTEGMDASAIRIAETIQQPHPEDQVDIDWVMGRQIISTANDQMLAGTLPYRVIVRGVAYDEIPESLMNILVINRYDTRNSYALDQPGMSLRVPTHSLGGHSVYVDYEVGTQAQRDALAGYAERNDASMLLSGFDVRPVLRIGDTVVAHGDYVKMGTVQMWTTAIVDPHGRSALGVEPYEYPAGSKISFVPNLGGMTDGDVAEFTDPLPDTVVLPVAQALHMAGLQYWFISDLMGEMSVKGWGGRFLRRPSVGAFAQPMQVSYFFGIPRTGFFQGFSTDIKADSYAIALNDRDKRRQATVQYGAQASLVESLTWDLLQGGEPGRAMSAATALVRAIDQKTPILTLTRDNIATALPRLQLSVDAEQEIEQSVAAGLIVIAPELEYNDGRGVGAGYIILDPETGGGVFRIDGGLNGGLRVDCLAFAVLLEIACQKRILSLLASRLKALGIRILARFALAAVFAPYAGPILAFAGFVLTVVIIVEVVMVVAEVLRWARDLINNLDSLTPEELAQLGISAVNAIACNYFPGCAGGLKTSYLGSMGVGQLTGGNPISGADGVKFQTEVDYVGAGAFPLEFSRHYYSNHPNGSPLGHKWGNRYFSRIRYEQHDDVDTRPKAVLVARGDGGWAQYVYRSGEYVANGDMPQRLQRQSNVFGRTTGWVYITGDDDTETYDAAGKLLSIRNRAGVEQVLSYNAEGQLTRVTDDAGRSLSFEYDDVTGQLVRMTDPLSRAYRYEYDDDGVLIGVTYPGNQSRRYHYEMPGRGALLTGITDERGIRYVSWKYDYKDRAIESVKAGGVERYTFEYGDTSTKMTDPYGLASTYRFRTIFDTKYIASSEQPCSACGGGMQTYEYNANGDPVALRDFNGNLSVFAYNERRLPTQMTVASGTPEAQTRSVLWHPQWRLPTRISEPSASSGSVTMDYAYNAQGEVDTMTVTADGQSRQWRYTYNARGQATSVDGPRTDIADISRFAYDAQGNLASATDANGLIVRYTQYDVAGKLLTMVDANGMLLLFAYDERDRVRSVTEVPAGQSVGETTAYVYNGAGDVTRVQWPDGSALNYAYDDAGRLIRVSDTLGNRIDYTLNAAGDTIQEDRYDPQGRLAQTQSRVFNAYGDMTEARGAETGEVARFGYDANSNLTSLRAPLRTQATRVSYDALDRIKASTDTLNGQVGYRYDAQNHLREVIDPRGLRMQYGYNGFDEPTALTSPDTGDAQHRYDAASNLTQTTDARGVTAQYRYDAANRLTQIAYPDETFAYTYDETSGGAGARGQLTTVSDGSGRTRYVYDAQGRTIAKQQQMGADTDAAARKTIGMAYANGVPSALQLPSGASVGYRYGSDGRVREVLVNGQVVISEIDHFVFGGMSGWTTPAGRYQRQFDRNGRIVGYTRGASTTALQYDLAGRIAAQGAWTYDYDANDRLVAADGPQHLRWRYDATGHRIEQTDGGTTTAYNIDATSNRLASVGASAHEYDAVGNTTSADGKQFVYNTRNRMTEVRQGASVLARYAYNAAGERVCVANNGGSCPTATSTGTNYRQYVYDAAGHLLGEYDSNGNLIAEHLWLGDTPIAVLKPASSAATHGGFVASDVAVYFVHPDHLDTPRSLVNANGSEVWTWDSAPFGDTLANENPTSLGVFAYNLRFAGQQFDAASGLHYNYFRDYDPTTGRYLQSDPIGLLGGLDTYGYVGGNPINDVDPLGLLPKWLRRGGCVGGGGRLAGGGGRAGRYGARLAAARAAGMGRGGRVGAAGRAGGKAGGANRGAPITNGILAEARIGNGTKGQGSGNKVDQRRNQQVVGADGKPIPIYEVRPNGPHATQEFPSTPVAHGFPDIVDNYAGNATKFQLRDGASLYQAAGSYNGVVGRFEWIVDSRLGGVTHRMFVSNGSINGIPVKP